MNVAFDERCLETYVHTTGKFKPWVTRRMIKDEACAQGGRKEAPCPWATFLRAGCHRSLSLPSVSHKSLASLSCSWQHANALGLCGDPSRSCRRAQVLPRSSARPPQPPSPLQEPFTPAEARSAEWMEQHPSPEFRVTLEVLLGAGYCWLLSTHSFILLVPLAGLLSTGSENFIGRSGRPEKLTSVSEAAPKPLVIP
eukprot:scaffold180652_cov20-Tisochrysis_lutea.AAC.3